MSVENHKKIRWKSWYNRDNSFSHTLNFLGEKLRVRKCVGSMLIKWWKANRIPHTIQKMTARRWNCNLWQQPSIILLRSSSGRQIVFSVSTEKIHCKSLWRKDAFDVFLYDFCSKSIESILSLSIFCIFYLVFSLARAYKMRYKKSLSSFLFS